MENLVLILSVTGMTCAGCEVRIEKKLRQTAGVSSVNASYAKGVVTIEYAPSVVKSAQIIEVIKKLGYKSEPYVKSPKSAPKESKFGAYELVCVALIFVALSMVLNKTGFIGNFPVARQNMSYIALFVVGLLTSVHCVAMCGGITLTQCANNTSSERKLIPSLLYNFGRVVSYTVLGGVFGLFGSVLSISSAMKGAIMLFAGAFMLLMGLNMLNIFPRLRRFNPKMPKIFVSLGSKVKGPFVVGLFNGLMPCGPLQAMQLYAIGTGSIVKGALAMFFFSIGTVPLMFGLGALSSMLTKKFTQRMSTVSAVLVILLGLGMSSNGLNLAGVATPSFISDMAPTAVVEDNVQVVTVNVAPSGYEPISVKVGVPVKLLFQAKPGSLNGCNNRVIIPKYDIDLTLKEGATEVNFTPQETGTIPYSCWMGMIRSTITTTN